MGTGKLKKKKTGQNSKYKYTKTKPALHFAPCLLVQSASSNLINYLFIK